MTKYKFIYETRSAWWSCSPRKPHQCPIKTHDYVIQADSNLSAFAEFNKAMRKLRKELKQDVCRLVDVSEVI